MKACKKWLYLLQLLILIFSSHVASAQLTANFSATPVSGCPPLIVTFQNLSTGNPTSWKWDLGNGTQSVVANPVGTYFDPGTYTVKLLVRNASNAADSIVKTQFITVFALPSPAFKASDTTGCFPLRVQFTESSTAGSGTISNYQWDFGDGNLSNQANPIHTYTNSGNFTVILRVTNSNGCSKLLSKPSYIKTSDGVKAAFNYTSGQGCTLPTPVTFTNNSTGTGAISYLWNFGDGNTSTLTNPVHNYTTAGVYTIRLIVRSAAGCADTLTKVNAITIGSVQANFTRPDTVCVGANANFTNTSMPATVGASWTFGDGTFSNTTSPVKVFTVAGLYNVKLVNDFGSCLDSITKSIRVLAKPQAGFTANNVQGCTTPHTVSFTSTSVGATSYLWNFGNGSSSTAANPSHTFNQAASYTITLIVRNAAGCSDTLRMTDFIRITPPKINSISNLNVLGCLPYTITPIANIQSNQTVSGYFWDFGDGSTSTAANPSHTYTVQGIYNVKLKIVAGSGCTDSITINTAVTVGTKPVANFAGTPRDVCAYIPVYFTDLSTGGPITQWFWDFGDGGTSTLQNPIHNYGDTGKFDVILVVFNFGCADTIMIQDYIYVRPPIANFDTTFLCSQPLTRNFVDKSIAPQSWAWDFGDGNTSALQSPTHTYAAPGLYKVKLTVTNGTCFNIKEKDILVIKETGMISISDSVGCRNTQIDFAVSNVNIANIRSYAWYFNGIAYNGIITAAQTVSNNYSVAGNYNAAVILTNQLNCKDTLSVDVTIKIYGPKVFFRPVSPGTCLGSLVTFIDSTLIDNIHPIVNWTWDYGDSTIQSYTAPPFTHNYLAAGIYPVKLVVEDSYGCKDSLIKPAAISISKPVANFTASDTLLCPSATVTFTNTSSGGFELQYLWKFGDGTTAADLNTSHTYSTQGTFPITLIITDKFGCVDSIIKYVKVYRPIANFSLSDSFSSCPPLLVDFTNLSQYYVGLNWDFGDGGNSQLVNPSRIYTYPGIYKVKLWVQNNGGCVDTLTKTITIQGPTGVFNYNPLKICSQGTVNFTANTQNTVKYIWDYNDGTIDINNQPSTTHVYGIAGNYIPKLILEDASGCRVPIVGLDTVKVLKVKTFILAQSRVLCDSGMVSFSDSTISLEPITSYQWSFGDGTTATNATPVHFYQTTGWYNVSLITTTAFGCSDTAVYNNFIKIVSTPSIRIVGDTAACEPATFTFQGAFNVPDTSAVTWAWNFGNGNNFSVQNPPAQSYISAGSYPVSLTVSNSDGCTTLVNTTAIVHPKPIVSAGTDTTICKFNSYTLTATGASQYTWQSDPTLSCTNCASPAARPLLNNAYIVSGTTAFGCSNSDTVILKVKQPINLTVSNGDTLCVGESKQLFASGAEFYQWTPAAGLDNSSIANPRSRPDSTTTYMVIGTDSFNCFKDSGYLTLTVYPIPKIDILNGDVITLMVGKTVKLNTKSSPDVTNWRWMPGNSLSCTTCPEPNANPTQNIIYTVLASNDGNCIARDQVTINLICDNANIYIPNTFSPNDDGTNDIFYARGTGLYTIKTIRIFNRWGQLLFEKTNVNPNNPSQGWNGTHNGIKVQPDVYVYVMEAVCDNNTIVPIKGNVTLLR